METEEERKNEQDRTTQQFTTSMIADKASPLPSFVYVVKYRSIKVKIGFSGVKTDILFSLGRFFLSFFLSPSH